MIHYCRSTFHILQFTSQKVYLFSLKRSHDPDAVLQPSIIQSVTFFLFQILAFLPSGAVVRGEERHFLPDTRTLNTDD